MEINIYKWNLENRRNNEVPPNCRKDQPNLLDIVTPKPNHESIRMKREAFLSSSLCISVVS
jgi:hypothetical protein